MNTNANITIYHRSYNPQTRLDEWQTTQYIGVNWYGKQAVAVGDAGLNTADAYIVRIPTQQAILVCSGDIIVNGLIDDLITAPAQLKQYQTFVVTAVFDNRRGSQRMQHWRIEGA